MLVSPIYLSVLTEAEKEKEPDWVHTISVKTQIAGIKVHHFIILLFRYLSDKYFDDFQMMDESQFWETGDEEIMKRQFRIYDQLLDSFTLALQTVPTHENENMTDYFEQIMQRIKGVKKDGDA